MKRALPLLALLLVACSTPTADTTEKPAAPSIIDNIKAEEVEYGDAKGYMVRPDGDGPYPAIILIHDWWGLNDNIRWHAEQLAKQGYVALAVDLFHEKTTEDVNTAKELSATAITNVESTVENLEDASQFLKRQRPVDDDRIGSIGWGFGGGWAFQMAKSDMSTKVTVVYYGPFSKDEPLDTMTSLMIGHYSVTDKTIPINDVRILDAKLGAVNGANRIYTYPEGNGFAKNLNNESAKQAWDRTLAYLKEHL